jgi:hypothetical protein
MQSSSGCRQDLPETTAESDAAEPIAFTESAEDDLVAIFQKLSLLAGRQGHRLFPA